MSMWAFPTVAEILAPIYQRALGALDA